MLSVAQTKNMEWSSRHGFILLNPLKPNKSKCLRIQPIHKKTKLFTITKIKWLMLFEEIIIVYSENHMKFISTK
jgi:hypothetical protein